MYTDPTTGQLYELFGTPGSIYFVSEEEGRILGGCGIFPTKGLPEGHAELVKLYLREEARGKGLGRKLMEVSISWAAESGYTKIYLETFKELSSAIGLYRSLGFQDLPGPLGDSGHHACPVWMLLDMSEASDFSHLDERYEKSLAIREEVFIREQRIDRELELEHEAECRYFLVSVGGIPAATGRLRAVGEKVKFERIATLKKYRGKNLGRVLMEKMTEYARKNHPDKVPAMNAQLSAAGFYERIGWTRVGEIFTEAGIPHVAMTFTGKSF